MRLKIGSGFGIPVYIHWTFLLLPLWLLLSRTSDAQEELLLAFAVVPPIFACVVFHEYGHALAARYFGIGTQDITLYPIGGVARLKRMSDKPLEEFVIAVAGPAVNVVIAIVLSPLVPLAIAQPHVVMDTFVGKVALVVLVANVIMVLFNLLPAFPMDGGRVLRAVLASGLGQYKATLLAVRIGVGMAALMAVAGMLTQNYMLVVLALFVFFAGQQEMAFARYRERQRYLQDEEPLEVLPVRPMHAVQPVAPVAAAPALWLQPKISVYTWDNQTGLWRKDSNSPG
jgi:Zn-dependent protease